MRTLPNCLRSFPLALAAILPFFLWSCSLENNPSIAFYNQAFSKWQTNDLENAVSLYESSLESNPNLEMATNNLALCHLRQENFAQVVKEFNSLLTQYPTYAYGYYNRALAHGHLEDFQAALADLDRAIELIQVTRDSSKAQTKDDNTAPDAQNLNPGPTRALAICYAKRAQFRQKLKLYQGAIMDYDSVLKIRDESSPLVDLSPILVERGKCELAIAIHQNSDLGDIHYHYAVEDFSEAIACSNNPEIQREALFHKAICILGLKRSEESISEASEIFSQTIEYDPTKPEPYIFKANCDQILGLFAEAILGYSEALALAPENVDALFNRGNCYVALEQYELAIIDYSAVIGLMPEYANAWFMRARLRQIMGDTWGALEDMKIAGEKGHPKGFALVSEWEKLAVEGDN